jgi:hypothetical protein
VFSKTELDEDLVQLAHILFHCLKPNGSDRPTARQVYESQWIQSAPLELSEAMRAQVSFIL